MGYSLLTWPKLIALAELAFKDPYIDWLSAGTCQPHTLSICRNSYLYHPCPATTNSQ